MNDSLFVLGQFERWLQSNANALVGHAGTSHNCPLAEWLKESQEYEWVEVLVGGIRAYDRDQDKFDLISIPGWVSRFVAGIDAKFASYAPVLGREALGVLEAAINQG